MLKQGIISFFEYLLMLMIILEFNTPYTYFPIVKNIVILFIIISAIVLILFNWRNLTLDVFAFTFLIIVGAIFPFFNVYEGRSLSYVKLYFVILPLFLVLLSSYMGRNRDTASCLLIKFSNLVAVIAIISLFFWLIGSTLELIPSTAIIPNSWGGDRFIPTYYGVYFETQEAVATTGAESMTRNSGIFNEGPMYNMILCTSLAVELFVRKYMSITRIIVLVTTIITTISTTGFIFLFVVLSIKAYTTFFSKYGLQMLLLLPIALLIAISVVSVILDNKKEAGTGSYNSRSNDIVKCIEVGLEHPISGVGILFKSEENSSDSRSFGYSNSLFGTFAHGGLYFLLLYLIPLSVIPIFAYFKNKDIQFLAILLCYFLLFSFTKSQYRSLTILFVAYGFSYWFNEIFERKWA